MSRASRATDAQQKAQRRAELLRVARSLFRSQGYAALTMAQVADAAGVAKGTVYLSFPTKEALFLVLLEESYVRWFDLAEARLQSVSKADLAKALAQTVLEAEDFLGLMVLGPTVLEHNIDADQALAYKRVILARSARLSALLEVGGFVKAGQGFTLLLILHALVMGLQHHAAPPKVIADLLEHPELAPFRVDVAAALEGALTLVLRGLEA
jgi:AcrR family transcriptional regulator